MLSRQAVTCTFSQVRWLASRTGSKRSLSRLSTSAYRASNGSTNTNYRYNGPPQSSFPLRNILRIACCTALVWSVFRKEEKVKFMYEYSHQLNNALRRLIYIERVYPEFASLETSNYDQLLTYFEKIWFIGYVTDPSSRMDLTLGTIERQLEHWASFRKLTGSQRKEAHARLLSSFEKLQQVFLSSDEDKSIVKASAVVLCVLEAVGGLYSILAPDRSKDLLDIQ